MSGYVPVGNGIGAAWLATGQLHVVSGELFAQIERERRDGPRYVEAIRGAWLMRGIAFWSSPMSRHATGDRALSHELLGGIPAWFR